MTRTCFLSLLIFERRALARAALPLLLFWGAGCAALGAPERSFQAPPGDVRAAVLAAVGAHDDVRQDGDVVRTGWGPEVESGAQGLFLGQGYRYRTRYVVALNGSAVSVSATVERRAPGGPRSIRWERVDGDPAAELLLEAIGRRLEKRS
jgi:hypothetical protein